MFTRFSRPEPISARESITRSENFYTRQTYNPTVIVLNGAPGVGKLTVAKALQLTLLNSIVLDNHTLIDAVESLTTRQASNYSMGRKMFLHAAVETMKQEPDASKHFVITDVLSTKKRESLKQYVNLAKARGIPVIVVNLFVSESENKERVGTRGRRSSGTGKATDPDFVMKWRGSHELLDPGTVKAFQKYGGKFKDMNVTSTTPVEAATEVLKLLESV